jgi:hypothetical protein
MIQVLARDEMKIRQVLLFSWVRANVMIWVIRSLLIGWMLVGQQIVIRPEFGVAGMFGSITEIPAELYGWAMILLPLAGIVGTPTRNKVFIAQIPAWVHLFMAMIYNYFEASGNIFALPFPTYGSICITLFLLAQVLDD